MNEIEKLENNLNEYRKSYTGLGIAITLLDAKIDELKKEAEVKPVFPPDDQCVDVWIITWNGKVTRENVSTDYAGRKFYSKEDAEKALASDKAKKYIIEVINKVNRGDNGFKPGENNYLITLGRNSHVSDYEVDEFIDYQHCEDGLYFRSQALAVKAMENDEFFNKYRFMLGIES